MIVRQIRNKNKNVFICNEQIIDINIGKANINSISYYFLFDSLNRPIEETFLYQFSEKKNLSINSKYRIICSLRELYLFCALFDKRIETLSKVDEGIFIDFINGKNIEISSVKIEYCRSCTNKTAKRIYNDCSEYCKYLNINFIQNKNKKFTKTIENYYSKIKPCPKFISKDEYDKIIIEIDKSNVSKFEKLRNKLIVILQYEFGLRIGEVLGLTLEDIKHDRILIRNRITDKWYQCAKTCSSPVDKASYRNSNYIKGCQYVCFKEGSFKCLEEYLKHLQKHIKRKKKRFDKAKADSVDNNYNNHYIFLNNQNSPLSPRSWNAYLREIYQNVGIKIDEGRRDSNLNHKLRHGYVMHLLYDLKMSDYEAMQYTRHKSVSSLYKYHNLTPEQKIEFKENLEKEDGLSDWLF